MEHAREPTPSAEPAAPAVTAGPAVAGPVPASFTSLALALQRSVGNRAATRQLARLTLKEKVEQARAKDPRGYVLKAVQDMKGKFSVEERTAEITWRMIWMFLPEKTNTTLVQASASGRGVELRKDPPGRDTELVVGPDFIDGITDKTLDDHVMLLRLVFLGKDALKAKLKADFGFADVVDGTATWTAGELAETTVGLLKMPAEDRKALAGVTLKRDETVTEGGESFSGLFSWQVSEVTSTTTTAPTLTQELTMATSAFSNLGNAAWTAAHEAGHAVDSARRRPAALAAGVAAAAFNATVAPLNAASAAATAAFNATVGVVNGLSSANRTSAGAAMAALRAAQDAIRSLGNAQTAAEITAREPAADRAVAARDRVLGGVASGHPAQSNFTATATAQDTWLVRAKARAVARTALLSARSEEAKVSNAAGTRSRRLERFVTLVNQRGIAPITPYAAKNWPGTPDEFFAEAYTMWLNDPARLESLAKPLKDWFDAGEHLK